MSVHEGKKLFKCEAGDNKSEDKRVVRIDMKVHVASSHLGKKYYQ